jgi:uncharacterized protein YndB with AHSA1/START domain
VPLVEHERDVRDAPSAQAVTNSKQFVRNSPHATVLVAVPTHPFWLEHPVTLQSNGTFLTSRLMPFSPEAIYGAFESPKLLHAWWGPEGFTNTVQVFEFVEGGAWHLTMHGLDGEPYANKNVFAVLHRPNRIAIRHDCEPYFTLVVAIEAQKGSPSGQTLVTWSQQFDDVATAQSVKDVVEPGNEENLDRLMRVLALTGAA